MHEEQTDCSPLPFCWVPLLPLLLFPEPSAESPARGCMRLCSGLLGRGLCNFPGACLEKTSCRPEMLSKGIWDRIGNRKMKMEAGMLNDSPRSAEALKVVCRYSQVQCGHSPVHSSAKSSRPVI